MYTYLIGWTKLNKWYYGVRFARNCNPSELWQTYFTSSKYVKEFRHINGEPDVIQIRKMFDSKTAAILWESKVLTRLDVIHKTHWLNRTNNKAIRDGSKREYKTSWNKGLSTPRTAESILKQKQTMLGKKRGPYKYNHKAKSTPVIFRGVNYVSIDAARRATGASFYTIKNQAASA